MSAARDVTLNTKANDRAVATADGRSGGFVSAGSVQSQATANGTTKSELRGINSVTASNLSLTAVGTNDVSADSYAASGGVVNAIGSEATATAAPAVATTTSGGTINTTGSISIVAVGLGNSTVNASGVGGGAIDKPGPSKATASSEPTSLGCQSLLAELAQGFAVEPGAVENPLLTIKSHELTIQTHELTITSLSDQLAEQDKEIAEQKLTISELLRRAFEKRSERYLEHPDQLRLDFGHTHRKRPTRRRVWPRHSRKPREPSSWSPNTHVANICPASPATSSFRHTCRVTSSMSPSLTK